MTNKTVNTAVTAIYRPISLELYNHKQMNVIVRHSSRRWSFYLAGYVIVNIFTLAKCDKIYQDIVVIKRLTTPDVGNTFFCTRLE